MQNTITRHLADQLRRGRLSRREFIGRAVALGVSAATASSMAATIASAQTPKPGGTIRLGVGAGSTTDTLDPGVATDIFAQLFGHALRNCLTEVDSNNNLVPELATDWGSSPDAKVWTFELRTDVEFHSGKTMDAEDVAASIRHHTGEESTSAYKTILTDEIDNVSTDGNTVSFHLKGPNADFPALMSDYHILIMPAKDGVAQWESGDGTGGYVLSDFEPGVGINMRRNPNYWKEGRAHFDDVELLAIKDTPARTNALRTGDIHVMDRPDRRTLTLLERVDGLQVEEISGAQHYTFPMRCDTAPFDNNDVRLALKYAMNREELVDKVLRGHGYVGNDTPIGRSYRYLDADLAQRAYDPDKAKFHLKKAGMDSLDVSLHVSDAAFSGAVDAATLYSESARDANINLTVVREPEDGYWSNVWMNKPWSASFWGGRITADQMFSVAYAKGAEWNESFWSNDRFNELLVKARGELNEDRRTEMYDEMQAILRNDGGSVIPLFANDIIPSTDKLAHGPLASNKDMDGLRLIERWWFSG